MTFNLKVETPTRLLKTRAVEFHDTLAQDFRNRYRLMERNPYATTFVYGRRKMNQVIERLLETHPAPAKLLDVGCGPGICTRQFADKGYHAVGLDMSTEMLRVARETNPGIEFIESDAENINLSDNSIDVIVSVEVIRYIPDPRKAITEFHRVLRPGGICIVSVLPRFATNGYPFFNKLVLGLRPLVDLRPDYFAQSSETSRSLKRKFRDAGFQNTEVESCFLGPFRLVQKVSPRLSSRMLKLYEPLDEKLSNLPLLRDLSNHMIIKATK